MISPGKRQPAYEGQAGVVIAAGYPAQPIPATPPRPKLTMPRRLLRAQSQPWMDRAWWRRFPIRLYDAVFETNGASLVNPA